MTCLYCEAMTKVRFDMSRMIKYSIQYIYQEKGDTLKWEAFYHRGVHSLVKQMATVLLIHIVSYGIFGVRLSYLFFIKGEYLNPLGVSLPFTNETKRGFIISASVNIIFAIGALLANITTEYCICAINNTIQSMADVIVLRIEELNEAVEDENSKKIQFNIEFQNEIKSRIRDIATLIQDFDG